MKSIVSILFVMILFASSVFAQSSFKIAAASSSGTYHAMLAEIKGVCEDDSLHIDEAPANGGATENLEALVNNQVSAAFLHSDVIVSAAEADSNYRNFKTLVALYPEEIHVLALRNSKMTKGGVLGYGATIVNFNSLSDLAGYNVGAAGGGVITAKRLSNAGRFSVIAFDKGDDVMAALRSGQVQAAIFVGGAPLPNLVKLNYTEFKLLPIGDTISGSVSGLYKKTSINYTNLKSGSVSTLAPMAVLLTRKYNTGKMIDIQAKFRQCFYNHLDELKETPGNHPKWQFIDASDHGVWDWLELPGISKSVTPKR
jgi:TRAP-type uncharacterized transport system substrate-binding protein